MPAAHINSLLLTAPVLNTLKLSNFCCAEISAMKGRQLSLMMQGHFKIPVSFSAALLRFYTDVRHQSISLNLAVSLNYGDGDKLFCQLSTSVTVFFLKANMTSLLSQLQSIKYFAEHCRACPTVPISPHPGSRGSSHVSTCSTPSSGNVLQTVSDSDTRGPLRQQDGS